MTRPTIGCPYRATDAGECAMYRERFVAARSDAIPTCPVHGAPLDPDAISTRRAARAARSAAYARLASDPQTVALEESYAPTRGRLEVRVVVRNGRGERRLAFTSGATVDEAVALACRLATRDTGDDSWCMDDWSAA